jgi:sporulation protein YlmC with PRC-barrel domain
MDNSESARRTKMPKVLCAMVMLALATAGPAFAQNETSAPASGSTGTSVPSPTSKEESGLYGSKFIGLKVFDKDGEHVGSIKDVLIAHNQLQKYVIAVGGSIGGIGEKNHAVDSDKLSFEHDPKGNLQARVGLSKDEVQQLAEYKY